MSEMQPTEPNQAPPLSVGYFDCEAACWTAKYQNSRHFKNRLAIVWQWLSRYHPGQELLDYGCGSGALLKILAEAGFQVTGVDISQKMLAEASQTLYTVVRKDNVRLARVDENFEGDYNDRLYDGIVSLGVLEYVDNYQALLAHFDKLLKPGGFLMVSFANRESWLRRVEQWVFRNPGLFRLFGLFPHLTGDDSYLKVQRHQFTVPELQTQLAALNFEMSRACYHAAPALLGSLEKQSSIGMTAVVELIKKRQ